MEVIDTIADYVRASLGGCSPDVLISRPAIEAIENLATALPGALTEFFGFECALGSSEGRADFLICIGAVEGGRAVLAGSHPNVLPAAFDTHWAWQRIRALAAEWNNPQSPLYDAVSGLWLEFDMEDRPIAIPVPSVFIGSNHLRRNAQCSWLTSLVSPILNGPSATGDEQRQTIARCLEALPPSAHIFQAGWMLSRPGSPMRLCVRGLATGEIAGFLRAIGCETGTGGIGMLVDSLSPLVERIDLDLDVAGQVLPKVGLEFYPAMDPAAVARLTAWLTGAGYCIPEKASALQNWFGLAHEKRHTGIWPRGLLTASQFLRGRAHSTFLRWLHHVKIVMEPDRPPRAKAYLGVRHAWVDPAAIRRAVDGIAHHA
jgi:hypothetical protein